jgi:hypothetical protein
MTKHLISTRSLAVLLLSASLAACGGGSSNDIGISGTISGLTTGNLILSNGYTTINIPSGNTGFIFGTRLPKFASYTVSVQSAPELLTCGVRNPSGIASGDVSNVEVVCVPNNTVGGSVTGLVAAGLTLTNGSDTVNVPANASNFVFPRRVGQGQAYGVTILSQPAGQTCNLANAVGTVGTTNVTSIQVNCI